MRKRLYIKSCGFLTRQTFFVYACLMQPIFAHYRVKPMFPEHETSVLDVF